MTKIAAQATTDLPYCPSCGHVMCGQIYDKDMSKALVRCFNSACDDYMKRYTFPLVTIELTSLDD